MSFLQMGLQNPLFKYVTEDGNVATFAETCADCGVCGATVVDMLQMESFAVNESSFNEVEMRKKKMVMSAVTMTLRDPIR